jgi:hypothetical protein
VTPRARRYLHTLGAIFAVFAVILLGMIGISPVAKELMPPAGFFAAIAALVGYIVYAQRRTVALVKEEAERSGEEADRALERLRASGALMTGVAVRWRARTYIGFTVVLVAAGAVGAWAWSARSWWMLALSGLLFAWAAKNLLARLGEPEVLRIGPMGIEDKLRFGLIPWQDIVSVFLHEYEIKGTKAASLSIGVRDPAAYTQRLGPVARFSHRAETLGFSDDIQFQAHTLNMAPLALFRLIRAFHERTLPAGAIFDAANYYRVDLEGAKMKQVMAELEKNFAGSASASGAPTRQQQDLLARMDALLKTGNERVSSTRASTRAPVEKTNWPLVLVVVIGLLIAALVGADVFKR